MLWNFPHNWQREVSTKYAFDTKIAVSHNGTEQRTARRLEPRISLELSHLLPRHKSAQFRADLAQVMRTSATIRCPYTFTRAASSAATGTDVLELRNMPPAFSAGTSIVVETLGAPEIHAITEIVLTTIKLATPLAANVLESARISLARKGRFLGNIGVSDHTDSVAEVTLTFEQTTHQNPRWDGNPSFDLFEGRPFYSPKHNWEKKSESDLVIERREVDFGFGQIAEELVHPDLLTTTKFDLVGDARSSGDRVGEILNLFQWARGRQRMFYGVPHISEFELLDPVGNGDLTALAAGRAAYDVLTANTNIEGICLFEGQSIQPILLQSVAIEGGNTRIGFAVPFSGNTAHTARLIRPTRFASDQITVVHLSDKVSTCRASFQSIRSV